MKLKVQLQPHQMEGVDFLINRKRAMLNFATGSGKSLIMILAAFFLATEKEIDKALFVGPKSGIISVGEDFEDNTDVRPRILTCKNEILTFLRSDETFAICNYNALNDCVEFLPEANTIKAYLHKDLKTELSKHKLAVFFDEFHTLKCKTSKVSKRWRFITPYCTYMYGVTASTYFKDLHDIYALVAFMDKSFFGTLTNFRDNYMMWEMKRFFQTNKMIPTFLGYKNLDVLKEKLSQIMCVYTPDLNVKYVDHLLKIENTKEYKKAAKGLYEEILKDDGNPKSWSGRLPDLQRVVDKDPAKKAKFKELASSLKSKGFIVYSTMRESILEIHECLDELGIEYKEITGSSNTADRKINKKWFNVSPQDKCLIISDAGGQSLNLQSVNNLIMYNLPFGIGKFIQIRGRIVRQFSAHEEFFIHFLTSQGTVDEYKYIKITQQEQAYSTLFGLSVANEDAQFTELNTFIINSMKTSYLWNT